MLSIVILRFRRPHTSALAARDDLNPIAIEESYDLTYDYSYELLLVRSADSPRLCAIPITFLPRTAMWHRHTAHLLAGNVS